MLVMDCAVRGDLLGLQRILRNMLEEYGTGPAAQGYVDQDREEMLTPLGDRDW